MLELRRAVPHHHLRRHVELGQLGLLERVRIDRRHARALRRGVQLHVDDRRRQVLGDGEAGVELLAGQQLGHQLGRDRLALGVDRELLQHLAGGQPVLVQLRGELDEVLGLARAGQGRIGDVGVQPVQGVAELVEHGHRVVPGDQHRLARRRLHEVGVVGDDDRHRAIQLLLRAVVAHPGAGVLALAGVGIEVPVADVLALAALDLIDRHVGVVDRQAVHLGEGEAVHLAGAPEHGAADVVELQVRLHLVHVDVVLRLAHLLGVVAIVPRRDLDAGMLLVGDGLHVGHLLVHARDRRRPHPQHQAHGRVGGLGHLVLELPGGVVGEAHQLGLLGPQRQDARDDGLGVVVGVLVVAAGVEGAPDLLAQVAPVRIGQERVHRRAGVEDRKLALVALAGCGLGGGVAQRLRQAGQVGFLEVQHVAVLVGEQVLAELGVEPGEFLVDGGDAGLGFRRQLGAVLHHADPVGPHQLLLLGRQVQAVALLVDRVHAGEQLGVLADLVLEGGDLGIDTVLDSLELGQVLGGAPHAVQGQHPGERLAGALLGDDGVVEARGRRIVGDGVDLGQVLADSRVDGRLEGRDLDLVERRHAAIGAGPGRQQGIGARRQRSRSLGQGRRGIDCGKAHAQKKEFTHPDRFLVKFCPSYPQVGRVNTERSVISPHMGRQRIGRGCALGS